MKYLRILWCVPILLLVLYGYMDEPKNVEAVETLSINLPSTIYGVVGKEINIYFDNLTLRSADDYLIDVVSTVGVQQNERWTWIPTQVGEYPIQIRYYDKDMQLLGAETSQVIVSDTATNNRTALFIGDSITKYAKYTEELLNLYSQEDSQLTLIGTKGSGSNKFEAIAGWTAHYFVSGWTGSPFVYDGKFNFTKYMTTNNYSHVDDVFIHLGTNDIGKFTLEDTTGLTTTINSAMVYYQWMIDSIHDFDPSIRIGIMSTIPVASDQDAYKYYGSGQNQWVYKRNNLEFVKSLIGTFENKESKNIYIVPTNVNYDTVHSAQHALPQPVNSRSVETVIRQSDAIHPNIYGYKQMADSVYYFMKNN